MKLPRFKTPLVFGRVRPVSAAVAEATGMTTVPRKVTRKDREAHLPDWKHKKLEDVKGNVIWEKAHPMSTVPNIAAIAHLYGWSIRYNEMTKRVELTRSGMVIPRDDQDNNALTWFGDDVVRSELNRDGLAALVDGAAMNNRYHPALDRINSTPWDGVSRLAKFHGTLELADPRKATLAAKLLDRWMLQGIGALLEPDGIAAQGMLVLAGPQHIGKTHWVMHLASGGDLVGTGLHLDPDNKDSVLRAIRYWIAELGELGATVRRADVEALKAFLTNMEDVLRLPYAKRDTSYRRRTIFVGTVNGTGFLVDDTGNRRFWVLEVIRCHALSAEDMQQVWAEYMHMYRNGARWHLDPQTLAELNAENERFTAVDPLREKIATRWDWSGTDWSKVDPVNWRGCTGVVMWKTASDVCQAIGIERPTRSEATRAGVIVRQLQTIHGQCHLQCHLDQLERRANGTRLLAVPAKTGVGQ